MSWPLLESPSSQLPTLPSQHLQPFSILFDGGSIRSQTLARYHFIVKVLSLRRAQRIHVHYITIESATASIARATQPMSVLNFNVGEPQ
jgi:hypothetical protein